MRRQVLLAIALTACSSSTGTSSIGDEQSDRSETEEVLLDIVHEEMSDELITVDLWEEIGLDATDGADKSVDETFESNGGDPVGETRETEKDTWFEQWLAQVNCWTEPPEDAVLADPPPAYSGGTCPVLTKGMNTIVSSGGQRSFLLALPEQPQDGESFPVLFLYYWLKGSASSFYKKGEIEDAVNQQRFIAVIPEAKGDLDLFGLVDLPWPILVFTEDSRFEEEFRFFDDMLACVSQQFPINKECVSVVGVSAGALFGIQLASARSRHISSVISLSGGTQSEGAANTFLKPYKVPEHKWAALVLWGGPLDSCALLNFQAASQAFEDHLIEGGQFFVECVHNCRHGEPPVEAPEGLSRYAAIWEFAFTHPYWLPKGLSPLLITGIPATWPSWCGIGKGSADPRVGPCPEPGCPI